MKRTLSALIAAGVLGTALAAGGPASAATSPSIDCEAVRSDWDYVWKDLAVPAGTVKKGLDNTTWHGNGYETTYEICLDVPDGETLTFLVTDYRNATRGDILYKDDRPGDKIVRFTLPPDSFFRYDGTFGPDGNSGSIDWYEKRIPHVS
ncbi:hypothetical protein [Nonomuraea sp. NPDC049309]|uniref:hypothetical protein n=1 Tax=Nonomuraea sp. NPDC049309 TaxID=3364350 RepID=UPI003717D838